MTCPDWSHKQINKRGEIRWQILFLMKQLNMSVSLQSWNLSAEEKEQAKKDMGNMLDYIDMLNELDTTGRGAYVPCISGTQRIPRGCS